MSLISMVIFNVEKLVSWHLLDIELKVKLAFWTCSWSAMIVVFTSNNRYMLLFKTVFMLHFLVVFWFWWLCFLDIVLFSCMGLQEPVLQDIGPIVSFWFIKCIWTNWNITWLAKLNVYSISQLRMVLSFCSSLYSGPSPHMYVGDKLVS